VALITSQVDKIYPFEITIEINDKIGKILTDQIYTIDKSRLGKKKVGTITDKQLWQLNKGLHMVLELKDC
jgi:mRNA-degrading endonuclease toxin of MazEF toxin-antitoxin module